MNTVDITDRIERLEALEDRLGVSLGGLSAFLEVYGDDEVRVIVRGELQPRSGAELQCDLILVLAVYDASGRIIGNDDRYFLTNSFYGLEVFDISTGIPLNQVAKIRLYPKSAG